MNQLLTTGLIVSFLVLIVYLSSSSVLNFITGNEVVFAADQENRRSGECHESDQGEDRLSNAYCQDIHAFKVDRCLSFQELLEWSCAEGQCQQIKINCLDWNGQCSKGACTK